MLHLDSPNQADIGHKVAGKRTEKEQDETRPPKRRLHLLVSRFVQKVAQGAPLELCQTDDATSILGRRQCSKIELHVSEQIEAKEVRNECFCRIMLIWVRWMLVTQRKSTHVPQDVATWSKNWSMCWAEWHIASAGCFNFGATASSTIALLPVAFD